MSDDSKPPPEDEDWGPREPWRQQPGAQQPGQPGQPGQQPPFPPPQQPGPQPWPQPGPQPRPQHGPPQGPAGWPGPQGQAPLGGPGFTPARQQSNAAQTMAIIGIVCILFCAPASIVLGLLAQNKYREQHQPDTLAKIAWIGGIVSLVLGIILVASSGA